MVDWGVVLPGTINQVNPEGPWPVLDRLRAWAEMWGKTPAPRLTVYPEYVGDPEGWLHPDVRFPVLLRSDGEGLGREHAWSAGGTDGPPDLLPFAAPARGGGPVGDVLTGVEAGQEVGVDELVTLLSARGPDLARVCAVADDLRRNAVGDVVTFVRNRNINYTNVTTSPTALRR